MPFVLLTVSEEMSSGISGILDVFLQLFNSAFQLITGNWFLLASVGLSLVSGILFAIISFFRSRY